MEVQEDVIEDTARIGIGEMSRRTGVAVRTIRFYCDEGFLECERTSGGHRMFDPTAVEKLVLLRRLRGVGVGLPAVAEVLSGSLPVAEAIAAERAAIDNELAALAWRRSALRAVEDSVPGTERVRLELLAAVQDRSAAEDQMLRFWRRLLGPLPPQMFDGFAFMNIPTLPTEPTPHQLLTYAELVAHLAAPRAKAIMSQTIWRSRPADIQDRRRLLVGLAESGEQVAPLVVTGAPPSPGPALDYFVAAHAGARGMRDTGDFRRTLLRASDETNPWIHRYWTLTGELIGPATSGAAQLWLHQALARSIQP
ncbi:MerR family transcriptional regulator [Nocardia sp. XZ_19_385]|uniref:helix-turn-helix domain-containing protein n=1 Tax=Nocardia sp. XZ_19_385 TaxID=2769488 RepID=UPI00281658DE|nr:MerR family transcriptional regulator [Nocardia sp. XZ_19_385]